MTSQAHKLCIAHRRRIGSCRSCYAQAVAVREQLPRGDHPTQQGHQLEAGDEAAEPAILVGVDNGKAAVVCRLQHLHQSLQPHRLRQMDDWGGHHTARGEMFQAYWLAAAATTAVTQVLRFVEHRIGVKKWNALELEQRMIDGMGEQVPAPFGKHDRGHDEQQELDVVGDLHHDDGEGHGEPGHAGEEGDGAEEGESPRVHPVPAVDDVRRHGAAVVVNSEEVDDGAAEKAAVERPDEQHGDDQAAGDLRTRRPAGQQEV